MITVLSVILINSFIGGPSNVISWVFYLLCTMPFFADMIFSVNNAFTTLTEEPSNRGSCTVEELTPANEENFLNADVPSRRQEEMYNPSDRLIPDSI